MSPSRLIRRKTAAFTSNNSCVYSDKRLPQLPLGFPLTFLFLRKLSQKSLLVFFPAALFLFFILFQHETKSAAVPSLILLIWPAASASHLRAGNSRSESDKDLSHFCFSVIVYHRCCAALKKEVNPGQLGGTLQNKSPTLNAEEHYSSHVFKIPQRKAQKVYFITYYFKNRRELISCCNAGLPQCGPDAVCISRWALSMWPDGRPGTWNQRSPWTHLHIHTPVGPCSKATFCLPAGQEEIPGHHPQLHGGARHRARHQHRAPAQLRQEPRHPEWAGPAVPPQGNQGQCPAPCWREAARHAWECIISAGRDRESARTLWSPARSSEPKTTWKLCKKIRRRKQSHNDESDFRLMQSVKNRKSETTDWSRSAAVSQCKEQTSR